MLHSRISLAGGRRLLKSQLLEDHFDHLFCTGATTIEVKAENGAKYWMHHVNCDRDEENLLACTYLPSTECKKGVRAGVTCLAAPSSGALYEN